MNIIQYDASNPILPEGLWWRWYDGRNVPQYSLQSPVFCVRDAAVVLKGVSVVLDGDLILYDCNSQPKREIVRKGSLAFKFLEDKLNPCKAIDLGPRGVMPTNVAASPKKTFKVGDKVRTTDKCVYKTEGYLGEGVIVKVPTRLQFPTYVSETKSFRVSIRGQRPHPYDLEEIEHIETTPKVEPKFKVGDVVKTKSYIKTSKDLRGVEGVVVSFVGMIGVALLGIEKVRYFQPEEIYDVNLNQKVEPKDKEAQYLTEKWKPFCQGIANKLQTSQILENQQKYAASVNTKPVFPVTDPDMKTDLSLNTYFDAFAKNMSSAVDRELIDKILKVDVSGDEAVYDALVKQLEGDIDREIVRLSLKDTQDILDKAASNRKPPVYSTHIEFKKVYHGTWTPHT